MILNIYVVYFLQKYLFIVPTFPYHIFKSCIVFCHAYTKIWKMALTPDKNYSGYLQLQAIAAMAGWCLGLQLLIWGRAIIFFDLCWIPLGDRAFFCLFFLMCKTPPLFIVLYLLISCISASCLIMAPSAWNVWELRETLRELKMIESDFSEITVTV